MMEQMKIPRILLAAGASGSGKTLITCGILQALLKRGLTPVSFKCGPDYIDPMFHTTVLGTRSRNLDTFFTEEQMTRYLFARNAFGADLAVIEGVMGYYDGLGGISERASAYDVAGVTDTPVVLIVNCKGMSLSVIPYIKGFLTYRKDSRIRGVILNRLAPALYPRISERIRTELGIVPLGYVPEIRDLSLESRHLGLVMPDEIEGIREKLDRLADTLEGSLDLDAMIALAGEAPDLEWDEPLSRREAVTQALETCRKSVVAVARDEAFCFTYEDNLDLLRDMGAKIRFFSPVHDAHLPACDGLILSGGYPELYLKEISENESMREEIRLAVAERKLPCMAECGGFMYLQQEMEDMEGTVRPTAGVLPGSAFRTQKLTRFGYIELTVNDRRLPDEEKQDGTEKSPALLNADIGKIRAHEFHYFDTTQNGNAFHASKPLSKRGWDCICMTENLLAGFPHLYYHSNPQVALRFLKACSDHTLYSPDRSNKL